MMSFPSVQCLIAKEKQKLQTMALGNSFNSKFAWPILAVLFSLCTLLQARGMPDIERTSPQFLYMEYLHELIKDSDHPLADLQTGQDKSTAGNLVATSIEALEVTGKGLGTNDSFEFSERNSVELQLTVPNKKDSGYIIHGAELWLFPDQSQFEGSADSILELTLIVKAILPHANKDRREVIVYNWRPVESCIRLNVTSLSKKIANNLQKRSIREVNITISIEVAGVRALSERAVEPSEPELLDVCTTLGNRTRNTPFLAIKYFDKNAALRSLLPQTEELSGDEILQSLSHTQKRQAESPTPTRQDTNTIKACDVIPLTVDLSEIYGSFIIDPQIVDIGDCSGFCSVVGNYDIFSLHAVTKERMRLSAENERTTRETSCVPVRFQPLQVLIAQDRYLVIVEFKDMVVSACGCL